MREDLIKEIETYLQRQDFGKNWDGAYQDALPTIQKYLDACGFRTELMSEFVTESRDSELVARKDQTTIRVPWQADYNGRSLVDLRQVAVLAAARHG